MRAARAGITLLAFVAAGCGGGDGGTNPPPGGGPPPGGNQQCTSTSTNVTVANNNFSPRCTTVPTGTTVTWTWDSGGVQHNVTFTAGSSSGNQGSGTFQRAFPTAGTFAYECTLHGAVMSGEIRVQ